MKELIYLTTNPNKVNEANEFFGKKYGFNIKIVNPDFEILEIQAKTCSEVAAFSAEYGANKLGKAVLKSDSGLYIDALGGLPGPYNHYFDKQIGVEKFLELFKNEKIERLDSNIALLFVSQVKRRLYSLEEVQELFLMRLKVIWDVGMTNFIYLTGKLRH